MAKSLKDILETVDPARSKDEKTFIAQHPVKTLKLSEPTKDDKVFNATNIKRSERKQDRHGYEQGDDINSYDAGRATVPGSQKTVTGKQFPPVNTWESEEIDEANKVYDPFTKKMVSRKPIKVKMGDGYFDNKNVKNNPAADLTPESKRAKGRTDESLLDPLPTNVSLGGSHDLSFNKHTDNARRAVFLADEHLQSANAMSKSNTKLAQLHKRAHKAYVEAAEVHNALADWHANENRKGISKSLSNILKQPRKVIRK